MRRPPLAGELKHAEWAHRVRLRSELHALAEDLRSNQAEASILRAQLERKRQQAEAERAADRPAHARRLDGEADDLAYLAERRESRAEVCRSKLGRVRDLLRAAAPKRPAAGCVVGSRSVTSTRRVMIRRTSIRPRREPRLERAVAVSEGSAVGILNRTFRPSAPPRRGVDLDRLCDGLVDLVERPG